jgi:hypothetical protein
MYRQKIRDVASLRSASSVTNFLTQNIFLQVCYEKKIAKFKYKS